MTLLRLLLRVVLILGMHTNIQLSQPSVSVSVARGKKIVTGRKDRLGA